MYRAVVALEQHLCHSCGIAEVAVYLERRMGIEEVGIQFSVGTGEEALRSRDELYHIPDYGEGVVSVQKPCPEVDFPAYAPSGGLVASLEKAGPGCAEE